MIEVYDSNELYVGRAESIRGASLLSHENTRTISNRLNRPNVAYDYNYYTRDERGHLIRLAHEIMTQALCCEYPTEKQITILAKAKTELLK